MPWNAKARALSVAALMIGAAANAGSAAPAGVSTPAAGSATHAGDILNPHGGKSMTHIAGAANAFGFGLLDKLVKAKPDGNCFISPYSVQQALLLADNGAAGATKTQIEAALHLGSAPIATINAQAKALRESLTAADPKVKISVANALWADHSFQFAPSYQETCRAFYDAQAQTVALHDASGPAAINAWVAQKTEGKITSIVPPSMPIRTKAVLTNALYFHGDWTTPFPRAQTYPQDFYLTAQTKKQVPTMSREGEIDFTKTDAYEAVALPYGAGRLRMIAVLPAEHSSVNEFLASLTPTKWSTLTDHLQPTRLKLLMPKVHADYAASLKPALADLGVQNAFDASADFFPMDHSPDLFIGDVLHKTTLDIDEEGTTAAAATAVIMRSKSIAMPPPITVRIDRPFFCAIQDTQTGLLLFAGVIRNQG